MIINSIRISANFRYLWLKTVKDVDLSQHCAKCLIGEYDSRIKANIEEAKNIPLPDEVYYLCGVAYPYKWEKNFHLAFMPAEGQNIHYESNGIMVEIEGAVQLPISEDNVDFDYPKAYLKAYRTCRNYQFAHWFSKNMK